MTIQRLFIHSSPVVVFAARVNQAAFSYPFGTVTFDGTTSGDWSFIKPGMTVLFGSTAGADDKGRQRVRSSTSSVLSIGRSSRGTRDGEVDLEDNDYITVVTDYRVWSKIPAMDISDEDDPIIYKDNDIAFVDQTDEIPPKANIRGGAAAGTIATGTNLLTVTFNGSDSYAVADGATITGYSWDVSTGGTITAGTGTNTITATFAAGFRFVSLTVTDSNGKTHTTRVPVYAFNPASPTTVPFQVMEHSVTQEGQRCAFRILADIPASTYADGALVIFWEGEPSGPTDRTNVKFWGWHQSDGNSVTAGPKATLRDVVLNCVDVAGRLDTLPGFPQSVETHGTPQNWLEMKTPNMDKYIDYLLRWHSTAFENAYYVPSGTDSSYPFVILGSDGESLWDQVQRRAGAIVPNYRLTCNRNGELKVLPDPMLQEIADRTATSQVTIAADDWTAVNWEYTRPPRIHWLRGEAIVAHVSEIAPVFCNAPGESPGQGETEQTSGEQLAISQTDLNNCEGHRYARLNARNGLVSVALPDDDDRIQPAHMTWVTLDVSGNHAARRGLGFTTDRGLPLEVNISYEYSRAGLVKRAELLWEQETSGTPAVTYVPPEIDWDPPWIPPPNELPPPPTTQGDGLGTLYTMTEDVLARTRLLSAVAPAYVSIGPGGGLGPFFDFILDPWSPKTTAYLSTNNGLYKSTDMDTAAPTWSAVLTKATIEASGVGSGTFGRQYKVLCSINYEGFVIYFYGRGTGIHCARSLDGGATWSYTASWHAGNTAWRGAVDIVPRLIGGDLKLYLLIQGPGAGLTVKLYESADKGATWTTAHTISTGTNDATYATTVHCPYNGNPDGDLVYFAFSDLGAGAAARRGFYRTTDGGSTIEELADESNNVKRWAIETYTQDSNIVYYWNEDNELWVSTDGGDNWTQRAAAGLTGDVLSTGGFPYNENQYYVLTSTPGIFLSLDGGETFIDKTGNWSWDAPTDVGHQVIVPLWLAE